MWHDGSLYVAAPPSIWKLTDSDGDGVADKRVEWFQGKTLTGCANDLHGPYPGPDGWIYWCKGAFAEQTYTRPGKPPFVTRAAHIFRCRPDGSGIEPIMTGGMDNPVDVVFTPGGEPIFTTTFFVHPGGGQRDGLVHAIYGGIYGKVHDPIFQPDHKWTGPEVMPPLLHMGPAAPCGLTRYESDSFGPAYKRKMSSPATSNLHKVGRHVLATSGSTFATQGRRLRHQPRPRLSPELDVLEDADGSLIVVDTGGWYKLCCPTSQLHKPDVLGGIYRVKRAGAALVQDSRGRAVREQLKALEPAAAAAEIVRLLGDPRPAVQRFAIESLAEPARKDIALPGLRQALRADSSITQRRNAVWSVTRVDDPAARQIARSLLLDPDETVRQAAAHSAGLWRDRAALPQLVKMLEGTSMQNRRAAAQALGRIGDKTAVPALLAASSAPNDRSLEHSITYALIEIADPQSVAAAQNSHDPRILRTALVAMDQMEGGRLEPSRIAGLLAASDPVLKETASWIVGRHPEWAGALAGVLGRWLDQTDLPSAERAELEKQLGRLGRRPRRFKSFIASRLNDSAAPNAARRSSLQAMSWSGLNEKQVPPGWISGLAAVLDENPAGAELVPLAVAAARALPLARAHAGRLSTALLRIGADAKQADDLRLAALAAVPGGASTPDENLFAFLLGKLPPTETVASRTTAADVLARAKLSPEQLGRLAETAAFRRPRRSRPVTGSVQSNRTTNHSARKVVTALACLAGSFQAFRARRRQEPLGEIPRRGPEGRRSLGGQDPTLMRPKQKAAAPSNCCPPWPQATSGAASLCSTAKKPLAILATPSAIAAETSARI